MSVGSQAWSCSRKEPSPREGNAVTKRFSATAIIKSTQFSNNRHGIAMQRLACYRIVKVITALTHRHGTGGYSRHGRRLFHLEDVLAS